MSLNCQSTLLLISGAAVVAAIAVAAAAAATTANGNHVATAIVEAVSTTFKLA